MSDGTTIKSANSIGQRFRCFVHKKIVSSIVELESPINDKDKAEMIQSSLAELKWRLEDEQRAIRKAQAEVVSLRRIIELNPPDSSGPGQG